MGRSGKGQAMKITGVVKSKNDEAEGHSQVRIAVDFDFSGPNDALPTVAGQVILSAPGPLLCEQFKTGAKVTLTVEAA